MSGSTASCDTSVLVAGLCTWHPRHELARSLLQTRVRSIPAHVALETYSVLTRLPAPHRITPTVAGSALSALRLHITTPPPGAGRDLIEELAVAGICGGAVYDALVGVTCRTNGHLLLTADQRARLTYDALGVRYEVV